MALSESLRTELASLISTNHVVLFMKGNRQQPKCGFSASVTEVLDELLEDYVTVDVLERQDIRDGIKEFSNWPTIPQLYVRGEFVGGADIVRGLSQKGELSKMIGVSPKEVVTPELTITPTAAVQIKAALKEAGAPALRFEVDRRFQYGLGFDDPSEGDFKLEVAGITVLIDRGSAQRANGTKIDFVDRGPGQSGFKITNPNEPARAQPISARDLKAKLDAGQVPHLFDVRPDAERSIAKIPGSSPYDEAADRKIQSLDKSTMLVFHCHHGPRSAQAAQHYLELGFTNVFNLEGGIDAWSLQVDPNLPRY